MLELLGNRVILALIKLRGLVSKPHLLHSHVLFNLFTGEKRGVKRVLFFVGVLVVKRRHLLPVIKIVPSVFVKIAHQRHVFLLNRLALIRSHSYWRFLLLLLSFKVHRHRHILDLDGLNFSGWQGEYTCLHIHALI